MFVWTGLTALALGIVVWLFGNRMWLMGAGAGALIGMAILRLIPGLADGFLGFLIVAGLAVTLGVLAVIGKRFVKLIAWVIGFIAGGAVVLGFIDILTIDFGILVEWILAVIGGAVGAVVFWRYFDWGLIILASLVGSLLVVRGAMVALLPALAGPWGTLLVLVLTGVGIWYHYRRSVATRAKPAAKPAAKSA